MKRYGLFFALLPIPCALIACSYVAHATLFNNTSGEIGVEWEGEKVVISAGHHAEISYVGGTWMREVRLSSVECEHVYSIPPELENYKPDRKLDRGVQIQVEKDFSIGLLPANYAGDVPTSNTTFLQREGFPLQPVSRKCR